MLLGAVYFPALPRKNWDNSGKLLEHFWTSFFYGKGEKKKLRSTAVGYNIVPRLDYIFILLEGHYICRTFCWSESSGLAWQVLLVCNNSSISMGWIDFDS